MADGFPAPILADIPASGVIPANTPLLLSQRYFAIPTDLHEGRLQSWNAAYQRQLPRGFTAEVAYVGNRGNVVNTINRERGNGARRRQRRQAAVRTVRTNRGNDRVDAIEHDVPLAPDQVR